MVTSYMHHSLLRTLASSVLTACTLSLICGVSLNTGVESHTLSQRWVHCKMGHKRFIIHYIEHTRETKEVTLYHCRSVFFVVGVEL